MIGLNTPDPKVFWNGAPVNGIKNISVTNNALGQRVTLTFDEDPQLAEMAAAGIVIRRVPA